jgi:Ca2+-binding EF-hand superfamily protein
MALNFLDTSPDKQPNAECLKKCYDVLADPNDGKISAEDAFEVLAASGARLLMYEVQQALEDLGNPKRLDWRAIQGLNCRPRYLDDQWFQEDPNNCAKGNCYEQTNAAMKVLADSYGQNGLVDLANLRYVLTSCGEEMTDDEFEDAMRMSNQNTKGIFNLKKFLQKYAELQKQMGRDDSIKTWEHTKVRIEEERKAAAVTRGLLKDKKRGTLTSEHGLTHSAMHSAQHSRAPSEFGE